MQPEFFRLIQIDLPRQKIFRRLGYQAGRTQLKSAGKEAIERLIDKASGLLHLQGSAARLAIISKTSSQVTFESGPAVQSVLLARMAADSNELLAMGATAGKEIIRTIEEFKVQSLSEAVVYDAVASECADACFDWIQNYYNQALRRENKRLLERRISCGYGDFSLEHQQFMYSLLGLKDLGVEITKSFMLVPEKSATAVTAIV